VEVKAGQSLDQTELLAEDTIKLGKIRQNQRQTPSQAIHTNMQARSSLPISNKAVESDGLTPIDLTCGVDSNTTSGGPFTTIPDGQLLHIQVTAPRSVWKESAPVDDTLASGLPSAVKKATTQDLDQHVEEMKWSYDRILSGTDEPFNFGSSPPPKLESYIGVLTRICAEQDRYKVKDYDIRLLAQVLYDQNEDYDVDFLKRISGALFD